MNYYEHHIGDYAEATAHLSFVEDAAYSRMIRKYYAQEKPLPADVKAVQRLIGARTKEEREAVETVLQEFFQLDEDGWHNNRCDAEVARYQEKQRKAKASADARWNKNRSQSDGNANASPNAMRTHSDGNAHQAPDTKHQTPDTSLQTKTIGHPATDLPEDARAVSDVGALSIAMRRHGINSNPGDSRLQALAAQGVTPEAVHAACEDAKRAKPNENIGPAYVIAILERWQAEASKLRANANTTRPAQGNEKREKARRLADRIQGNRNDDPGIIDIN